MNAVTSQAATPAAASASSAAAITPADWSPGVVGVLAVNTRRAGAGAAAGPPPVTTTASVNVPPTSTARTAPLSGVGVLLLPNGLLALGEVRLSQVLV